MRAYRLDRLSDAELLRSLASLVSQDRSTTAALLAHIAEVDARRLYAPAGYPSMHAYCVGELRLSEDAAAKRIHAARAAREFPQVFDMVADGRLHLSGLCLLASHLKPCHADGLLAAATHKTKSEIEQLIAARNPRTESLPLVCAAPAAKHAPGHVRDHVAPIAAQRFVIQVSVSQEMRDKLEQLRQLLSHAIPDGDLAEVMDYALALPLRNQRIASARST